MNNLYTDLNGNKNQSDFMSFINQAKQFKDRCGNIDPKQEVMKCLQSGMINQQQLNNMQRFANQFNSFF